MLKVFQYFLKTYKKEVIAVSVLLFVVVIGFMTYSFAAVEPISSVLITSEKTSYENNEAGAWQVQKSAKWVDKSVAEVRLDVSSVLMSDSDYADIVFVLDISSSMEGQKLDRVKQNTVELLDSLLSNGENRAALITFSTESQIVSNLTNNKDLLTEEINNLSTSGDTNYYQALVNVDTILKNYQKEDNKSLIVLFLTDGYPNVDTPNQIAEYKYLKSEYPYIIINGVQYEMGNRILDPVKEISDDQFVADMETLDNVLFEISSVSIYYDSFEIVDYIENDYFILGSEEDITTTRGDAKLEEENGLQKITWTISYYKSGKSESLSMKLKLKDEFIDQGGVYPISRSEQIISQIKNRSENINSTLTPALQESYQITYDGNAPDGCTVENVPGSEVHSVFDVVLLSEEEPSCSGYQFKGWSIVTDGVIRVNDDYFIMPEKNVTVRATWSKLAISKTMDGTIYQAPTLYQVIHEQAVMDNVASTYVSSSSGIDFSSNSSNTNGRGVYIRSGTENNEYPILYYRGAVDDNHVKFAGFCWQIVRTTEDGGVKLIYNGVPNEFGYCNNSDDDSGIGYSSFNDQSNSLSDVGYMYGDRSEVLSLNLDNFGNYSSVYFADDISYSNGVYSLNNYYEIDMGDFITGIYRGHSSYFCMANRSTSCSEVYFLIRYNGANYTAYSILLSNGKKMEDVISEATTGSTNVNDSTIKTVVDSWYQSNMTGYTKYLEDTVWCNDRSVYQVGPWNPGNSEADEFYFNSYNRVNHTYSPKLSCDNLVDSFTVNSENGNGALTYPVALLTADEVMLAGTAEGGVVVSDSYLNASGFTMSPLGYYSYGDGFTPKIYSMDDGNPSLTTFRLVSPSISLRGDLTVASGYGSSEEPYELILE